MELQNTRNLIQNIGMTKVSNKVLVAAGIAFFVNAVFINSSISAANYSQQISTKVKIATNFNFMKDLLKALKADGVNCTSYVKNTSGVLGVLEEGNCKFNGQNLTLDLFPSPTMAKETVQSLKSFGGYFIGAGNWVIYLSDGSTAQILTSGLKIKTF